MKELSVREQIAKRGYISEIEPYVPSHDIIVTSSHLGRLDTNKRKKVAIKFLYIL